jgi:Second Messenger Oligonucleotide or Dinucleotide Synthetase domain
MKGSNLMSISGFTTPEVEHAEAVLDEIRTEISASDDDLREARFRRRLVLEAAEEFGVADTFNSGSLAHATVNNPVNDADCGVVLDRRTHSTLGPDSEDEEGPDAIMEAMRDKVMPIVRGTYPDAEGRLIKRAILVRFKEENENGIDPTVDLIVGLTRKDADGIWIPNRNTGSWDASDPKAHTKMLTAEPKDLRVHRARVIRLAKTAIKSDSTPALISFNVEAIALEAIIEVKGLVESLQLFFSKAATNIGEALTEDPAGVSGKIKPPEGMTRSQSSKRLRFFADKVQEAIDAEDREGAEVALAEVFPDQLPDVDRSTNEAAANAVRSGNTDAIKKTLGIAPAAAIKPKVRSYGDGAAS